VRCAVGVVDGGGDEEHGRKMTDSGLPGRGRAGREMPLGPWGGRAMLRFYNSLHKTFVSRELRIGQFG